VRVVGDASGGREVSWLIASEGCIACASAPQRRSPSGHCGHGPVFCDAVGDPLSPTNETKRFQRATTLTGLPEIRFYDLRHTAATILLIKGVHVKLVSEMLGHSTITLTLDTYSHVIPAMHADAAAAMDEVFSA
jgi:integrase